MSSFFGTWGFLRISDTAQLGSPTGEYTLAQVLVYVVGVLFEKLPTIFLCAQSAPHRLRCPVNTMKLPAGNVSLRHLADGSTGALTPGATQ